MRTRAVAYVRVSTDEQSDRGVSLDAQRARIEAYASIYDLEIITVESDTASGKTLERPALQRALSALDRGGAAALIVAKLDRLTRSVRDLGELLELFRPGSGVALLSVGEQVDTRSAAGRLVLHLLTSVAQWEREAIGERTSSAMRHMRAQGLYTGGRAPYGFRVAPDGALEPDPTSKRRSLELASYVSVARP